jgi:NAD-dependent SIR2 family protein deacetylase
MDREKELRELIATLKAELNQVVTTKGQPEYSYCSHCQKAKPVAEFGKDGRGRTRCYCKVCFVQTTGQYTKTAEGRQLQRERSRRNREKEGNRERQQVRGLLSDHIQQGLFPAASTKTCVKCGQPAVDYHHHNGYDRERWDDVIPVCRRCHRQIHSEEKEVS